MQSLCDPRLALDTHESLDERLLASDHAIVHSQLDSFSASSNFGLELIVLLSNQRSQ